MQCSKYDIMQYNVIYYPQGQLKLIGGLGGMWGLSGRGGGALRRVFIRAFIRAVIRALRRVFIRRNDD